jgi:hypothetical protein
MFDYFALQLLILPFPFSGGATLYTITTGNVVNILEALNGGFESYGPPLVVLSVLANLP